MLYCNWIEMAKKKEKMKWLGSEGKNPIYFLNGEIDFWR